MNSARGKWALLLGVSAFVVLLDQMTKRLVLRNLALGETWNPISVLKPFVSVTRVGNTGAVFGLFRDYGTFFAIVAVAVVVAIIAFYRYLPPREGLLKLSLGLQLGGALGNLLDRVLLGSVVDFIDFKIWPVFNFADMAVVSGVCLLAYVLLFSTREDEQKLEAQG